jgi:hypothetical protein
MPRKNVGRGGDAAVRQDFAKDEPANSQKTATAQVALGAHPLEPDRGRGRAWGRAMTIHGDLSVDFDQLAIALRPSNSWGAQ